MTLKQHDELILNSVGVGIFGLDTKGKINFVNPTAALLLGYDINELLGNSISIIVPNSDTYLTSSNGYFHKVADGTFLKKDKTNLPVDYAITSIRNENDNYIGIVVAFQDISDRKLKQIAERKLQLSTKLESIGQLTGGVAHDFNNILLITQGNLELIENSIDKNSNVYNYVKEALKAVERGSELTKQILAFARKQTLYPKTIKIQDHLKNIITSLKPAFTEKINITMNILEDNLWPVWIDSAKLENAITNLVINAREAMPEGGELSIVCKNIQVKDHIPLINDFIKIVPGDYVNIAIIDNGAGMTSGVMERIFEPFYTTKKGGLGMGLGLSMVYGFIKQSNGYVTVDSTEGKGTTFNLYLPRPTTEEIANTVEDTPKENRNNTKVILIAEDEASILELVTIYLSSLGYQTMAASNGNDALDIIKSGKSIDLLFTDVVMPGMTGPELAKEAKKHIPALTVLFTSGYAKDALASSGEQSDYANHINKPYKLDDLATKILSMFGKKPTTR